MTLYDPSGFAIPPSQIAALREEQASPVLGGVRSVLANELAVDMTPFRLAQIHRAAAMGDTLAFQELAEDIEERDLHYAAVMATRRRSVTQLPMTIEAASNDAEHVKHKDFLQDWLGTGTLDDALFDILDAIGKGYSVQEIEWDISPSAIVPKRLIHRLARWFEIDRADGDTLLMRDVAGNIPMAPYKFVVHRHPSKTGLLLRSGIARVASWAWMFKSFTERDWATFVQNYGAPIRVGRYGPESSFEDRRVLWRAVSNIAGDCAAIIPKSMEITFEQPPNVSGAGELHIKRADYLNQQISKLVLGQTTTTDAIKGGHAVSQEHRLVQEDIERSDAKMLATTVTRQLFALIIAFNFGAQKRYPTCHIGREDEVPLEDVIKAVQFLGPQGLTLKASELRDQLGGFSEPGEADEIVGGRPLLPQAPTPVISSPELPTSSEDPASAFAAPAPGKGAPQEAVTKHTAMMRALLSRHTRNADPETINALTERVAEEAQGALAGLTHQVRNAIEAATSMHDMAHRLSQLQLDPDEFTVAMQRSLALANLVGQAALLEEIGRD